MIFGSRELAKSAIPRRLSRDFSFTFGASPALTSSYACNEDLVTYSRLATIRRVKKPLYCAEPDSTGRPRVSNFGLMGVDTKGEFLRRLLFQSAETPDPESTATTAVELLPVPALLVNGNTCHTQLTPMRMQERYQSLELYLAAESCGDKDAEWHAALLKERGRERLLQLKFSELGVQPR